MMPLSRQIYTFPDLPQVSFHGLPGMLADALPDKFGNAVIDAWLAAQGRLPQDIDAVERLCYTGTRGMGALEFKPALGPQSRKSTPVKIDALVDLAAEVLRSRAEPAGIVRGCLAGNTPCVRFSASAPPQAGLAPRRSLPGTPRPTRCVRAKSRRRQGSSTGC